MRANQRLGTLFVVILLWQVTDASQLKSLCDKNSTYARETLIDKVILETQKGLKDSEPFALPPERGVMRLRDGYLFGIHNFYVRHNDSSVLCTEKEAYMILLMRFNDTMVRYVWDLAGIPGLSSGFRVMTDQVTAEVRLSAPLGKDKPVPFKVRNVRVTEMGRIWVKVDGLGVLAWIASQIGNLGVMITRQNLKSFLTEHMTKSFQKVLDKYPI